MGSQQYTSDFFKRDEDGTEFAGDHIILDMWRAQKIYDLNFVQTVLITASKASGATIRTKEFHRFKSGGISGALILAESHITIHTWPERNYAAVDIFMCGSAQASVAANIIVSLFAPQQTTSTTVRRGIPLLSATLLEGRP
jgi:S-adenosylmethionine decarboxylase